MSSESSSGSNSYYEDEEILQIETRFKELRMEKDMLKDSQSQSFELIKRLESHLSQARAEDKRHIQDLERELSNCSQEIDYLQDQLHSRDTQINFLTDHVRSLELKLISTESFDDTLKSLRKELKKSNSERLVLVEELEKKEMQLQHATLCIENLEESISSLTLDYQCEIESMKLELMALQQSCSEADKLREEAVQENDRLREVITKYELRAQDAQNAICSDEENTKLRKNLVTFDTNVRLFLQKMADQFPELLDNKEAWFSPCELDIDTSMRGDILDALFDRLVKQRTSDAGPRDKVQQSSRQIHEYELLVSQLEEQLREERLKAKEEAEDLAQEMAELRYHMTELLEQECKRRACVEQLSLQRITELEAQVEKERRRNFIALQDIPEA